MTRTDAFLYGLAVAWLLTSSFVILDTIIHMPPERDRVCRDQFGHKHVPCPEQP